MSPFWLKMARREFDRKPIAAHLYVTDRCNLDCFYCTEFDNSVPHPEFEDIKKWIGKIKELGCVRIGLQGGEPLMHPDIIEIVRFCKSLDLKTSIATNGFKITKEIIQGLEDANLDSIHVSVDRMTPIRSTRKSLKSVIRKFDLFKKSNLKYSMSGVLFEESIEEAKQVLDWGLENNIPIQSRLVHAGTNGKFAVKPGQREALRELLDYQEEKKREGKKIQSSGMLIDYQRDILDEKETEWTCIAGYKYFFVSAQGKFWLCSMKRIPNIDIMDVTPEMLESYNHKKECQKNCGVYCIITESLAHQAPIRFAAREVKDRYLAKPSAVGS